MPDANNHRLILIVSCEKDAIIAIDIAYNLFICLKRGPD